LDEDDIREVVLSGSIPRRLVDPPVERWWVEAHETVPTDKVWRISVYAICAAVN
jgi:hypothetical protein